MNTHGLPPELWLHIFSIVLHSKKDIGDDEHNPFQPYPGRRHAQRHELTLQLALVCRTWHAWLLPTLCRYVKLRGKQIPLHTHTCTVV